MRRELCCTSNVRGRDAIAPGESLRTKVGARAPRPRTGRVPFGFSGLEGDKLRMFDPERSECLLTYAEGFYAWAMVEAELQAVTESRRSTEALRAEMERAPLGLT